MIHHQDAMAFMDGHFMRRIRFSGMNGAQGRDRTTDTAIFSRMLYQLSYLGTEAVVRQAGAG